MNKDMYTRIWAIFTITVSLSSPHSNLLAQPRVTTQVVPPQEILPIGSEEKVTKYALSQIKQTIAWAWARDTNDQFAGSWGGVVYGAPTNKYDLDQQIAGVLFTNCMLVLITNSYPFLDLDKNVQFFFESVRMDGIIECTLFECGFIQVKLDKSGTNYTVPDFTWFSMKINSDMTFYVPGLRWARLEYGITDGAYAPIVGDRRLDASTDPIASDGGLVLPTAVIMDSSTGGNYWMTLSLLTDKFRMIDGNGLLLTEPPTTLSMQRTGDTINITQSGGPSGRGYIIQKSTDMKNWSSDGLTKYVSPAARDFPLTFSYPVTTNGNCFFRSVTRNTVPY